jgi:hypothetical protein
MALKLDGIKTNKTTASKGKEYPIVHTPAPLKKKVDAFVSKAAELKALEAEVKLLQGELIEAGRHVYVNAVRDGSKESSVVAHGVEEAVLISFPNDFRSGADEESTVSAIGRVSFKKLFKQRVKFTINGDSVASLGDKRAEQFVGKLAALFGEFSITEALSAKEDYVPSSQADLIQCLDDTELSLLEESFKLPARVAAKK